MNPHHIWAPILSILLLIYLVLYAPPSFPPLSSVIAIGKIIAIIASVATLISAINAWLSSLRFSLKGKHVVITGGSQGLGLAMACYAARAGARVTIVARRETVLQEAAATIRHACPKAEVHSCSADVSQRTQLITKIAEAAARFGPVDVLIAAAGSAPTGYFADIPAEDRDRILNLNVSGCANAVDAVVGSMSRRGKGTIVFVSSALGITSLVGYTAYCPSKFAVRGLATSLRCELEGFGIDVHCAYPGTIDTPGFAAEQKTKPLEAKTIEAGETAYSAQFVSSCIWESVAAGEADIACGDLGIHLMVRGSSMMAPRRCAVVDVLLAPIITVVGSVYGFWWRHVTNQSRWEAARTASMTRFRKTLPEALQ